MAILFEIKHTTTYRYSNPVTFGTHRAMFLPRRGARGRLLNWSARTNLRSRVRWTSDNYDPTNHINAGFDLIASALARHPGQAVPLAGSWFGSSEDYLGMSVHVAVRKLGDVTDQSDQ